ncbi:MAG: peptidylprolyl isomerase [Burkholderiales bacterium]
MEIKPNCVVALTWTLKDTLGETLDVLDEPVEFLLGGADLLEKIEEALQGHVAGDRLDLHLEPEDAFGDYNEQRVLLEPRSAFPPDLEAGMTFDGHALPKLQSGQAPPHTLYVVTDVYPEHVILDGNHPLAGMALRIALKVGAVREATDAERDHGTLGSGFFRLGEKANHAEGEPPRSGRLH